MPGEFDFIRWIRSVTPAAAGVRVGPGDDCAVIDSPAGPLLVTTDVLTDGVDFLLAECGYRAVGRKAMAVNLSDIAAMAGTPLAAVVGVVFPLVPLSPGGEGNNSTSASARSPTPSAARLSAETRIVGPAGWWCPSLSSAR